MPRSCMTPLGALARGLLAGTVGTLAMDLVWYRRYTRGGGKSRFPGWEFSAGLDNWNDASAPGKLGKQLYEGFTQRELPAHYAALTNNVMHWGYGTVWGGLYGLVAGSLHTPGVTFGLPFGAAVWTSSYVILPIAGLYKPIWEYDSPTLLRDLSAHLAYGLTSAAAFALLTLA